MGRQAFPIVGGIIGAVVAAFVTDGAGTAQGYEAGFAIGAALGGIAGSYIDPIVLQGNTIGDTALQTASEGGARAIMFGQCCVSATCVIARGNRQVHKNKSSNGKGSSGSTVNQTVTWTFAIGLGEPLIGTTITRIWQDENLVYDVSADGAVSDDDNQAFQQKFRFYQGDESQLPDPDLQVFLGAQTPYFRGTSYVVFPNFDLTQTAERIPIFKFEVGGFTNLFTWVLPDPNNAPNRTGSIQLLGKNHGLCTVDAYFTGSCETRGYGDIFGSSGDDNYSIGEVGNVFQLPALGAWDANDNAYYIEIYDPYTNQTRTVAYNIGNSILGGQTGGHGLVVHNNTKYSLGGIRENSLITFHVDTRDGKSYPHLFPARQSMRIRLDVAGAGVPTNTTISLGEVAAYLMRLTGMTDDEFDVSALTDELSGVCIQSTVNGNDALNALLAPYFVDPCEVDGKLRFTRRGADVLRTLTVNDLTEEPEVKSRENVIEYPAKLSLFYQSPLTGYASTKATSYRSSPEANSSGEGSVTVPVTFAGPDEPAQIAQKLHKVMWTEAGGSFQWSVGMHCIDLVPSDVVGLYLRGIATRARITATENDATSVKLTMIKDRQSSYTSKVTGIPLPLPTPPQPATMSPSVLAVLDTSALQDSDDMLGYYTAISGQTAIWRGAQLQRSTDGGATWLPVSEVTTDVTMGRLTAAVSAASPLYTDTSNSITVQLFDTLNELHSYTDVEFLSQHGACAVQLADGTYELLQYRDCVDNGGGSYTLSYLQRGRKNTVSGTHAVGSLFVFLDTLVQRQAAQTAWIGKDLQHRAVSYGTQSGDAAIVDITYVGRSQVAWAPASAVVSFDGTNVSVSHIVPRYRFGTDVNPVPSNNDVGYRVTMTDGTSTVTKDIAGGAVIAAAPLTTVTSVTISALNKFTGPSAPLIITL